MERGCRKSNTNQKCNLRSKSVIFPSAVARCWVALESGVARYRTCRGYYADIEDTWYIWKLLTEDLEEKRKTEVRGFFSYGALG